MFSCRKLILNRTYEAKKKNTSSMITLKGGTTKKTRITNKIRKEKFSPLLDFVKL